MRRVVIIFLLSALLICLPVSVFAHPGRTDSKGGHYNRSTGEYHYHHGYGEHQHTDMDGDGILDCPYEFEEKEEKNEPPIYINPPPIPEVPDFSENPIVDEYFYKHYVKPNQTEPTEKGTPLSKTAKNLEKEKTEGKKNNLDRISSFGLIVSLFILYCSYFGNVISEEFSRFLFIASSVAAIIFLLMLLSLGIIGFF